MNDNSSQKTAETFVAATADDQVTLASFLRRRLTGRSWGQIRRLIDSRRVSLDGRTCLDAARRLTPGEQVSVHDAPLRQLPKAADLSVRYLDRHVVIVEKPPGLISERHQSQLQWPARRRRIEPTLDELLIGLIGSANRANPSQKSEKPLWGVQRLDRETSGLIVFARTHPAAMHLREQFREHTVGRTYLALVHGCITAGRLASRLVRDAGDGRRGSTDRPGAGKLAVTHVRPIEQLGDYSLVECRLETGRTHQIRIHLAERGNVVCGDSRYGPPDESRLPPPAGLQRMALHACRLRIIHPESDEPLEFEAHLPTDLDRVITALRSTKRAAATAKKTQTLGEA